MAVPEVKVLKRVGLYNVKHVYNEIPTMGKFKPRANKNATIGLINDCLVSIVKDVSEQSRNLNSTPADCANPAPIGRLYTLAPYLTDKQRQDIIRKIKSIICDRVIGRELHPLMGDFSIFNEYGWFVGETREDYITYGVVMVQVEGKTYNLNTYHKLILPTLMRRLGARGKLTEIARWLEQFTYHYMTIKTPQEFYEKYAASNGVAR